MIEIALTTPGGDKWPRIVPCRLEVCGDLVCTRCCCTCNGNNEKKNHDDILFDKDVLPKGHAVGLLPIVMIAELIVGSKVQNSTTTTCNFFIPWQFTFPPTFRAECSLSTTWRCILFQFLLPPRASPTIITKDRVSSQSSTRKWFPNTGCHQTKNQSLKKKNYLQGSLRGPTRQEGGTCCHALTKLSCEVLTEAFSWCRSDINLLTKR